MATLTLEGRRFLATALPSGRTSRLGLYQAGRRVFWQAGDGGKGAGTGESEPLPRGERRARTAPRKRRWRNGGRSAGQKGNPGTLVQRPHRTTGSLPTDRFPGWRGGLRQPSETERTILRQLLKSGAGPVNSLWFADSPELLPGGRMETIIVKVAFDEMTFGPYGDGDIARAQRVRLPLTAALLCSKMHRCWRFDGHWSSRAGSMDLRIRAHQESRHGQNGR